MLRDELIGGTIGTALSAVGTATQLNEVLQTISLILTILGALFTFVIMPLWAWYRKAKADGKITKEELKEGIEIVKDGSQSVKDKVEEIKQLDKREDIKTKKGQ